MALTNFSLPFGTLTQTGAPWGATLSPLHPIHQQLAANTNNLLYSPADHQQQQGDKGPPPPGSDFFRNNPYAPPQQTSQQTLYQYNSNIDNNGVRKNSYLPPIPPPGARNTQQFHNHQQQTQFQHNQQQQFNHINAHHQQHVSQNINSNNNNVYQNTISSSTSFAAGSSTVNSNSNSNANTNTRIYGEGTYTRFSQASRVHNNDNNINKEQQQQPQQYLNTFPSSSQQDQQTKRINVVATSTPGNTLPSKNFPKYGAPNHVETPAHTYDAVAPASGSKADSSGATLPNDSSSNDPYPDRPPGFTRVQAGHGSNTRVHAVLDYDLEEGEEEDYYDSEDHGETINKDGALEKPMAVTPIQGPIYLKNGTVPVVPLFHYPSFNNGSFVQIPIWWTALSVALGLDVRGDLIKGVPCIKRYHQLFCPTAGNSYPIDKIERFIDDNKALMRRMYGDFEMKMSDGGPRQQTKERRRRFIDEPDIFLPPGGFPTFVPDDKEDSFQSVEQGETFFGKLRNKRQTSQGNRNAKQSQNTAGNGASSTGRLDACESKIEIVTPYWASNSAGKIRAIVNTQHFEQAIHQEICSKAQTSRCQGECGCEQKYKWHRLLSYDPDNDCKGIFMDWFLFPSCCVCRCNP